VSVKNLVSLVTLPTANEQASATPATVTASGLSREYPELGSFQRAVLLLEVSAVSGTTPSLTVALEMENPLTLNWVAVSTFAAQTAVSAAPITATLELYGLKYRLRWTVTGTTPSFTFVCGAIAGAEVAL
jgi:hypothetical protein